MAKTKSILIKKEPAAAAETKVISLRVPAALHARMEKVKAAAAAGGYEVDLVPAVVAHVEALVAAAERELRGEGSGKKKTATASPAQASA